MEETVSSSHIPITMLYPHQFLDERLEESHCLDENKNETLSMFVRQLLAPNYHAGSCGSVRVMINRRQIGILLTFLHWIKKTKFKVPMSFQFWDAQSKHAINIQLFHCPFAKAPLSKQQTVVVNNTLCWKIKEIKCKRVREWDSTFIT